jgi:exonuclease VII large subunit
MADLSKEEMRERLGNIDQIRDIIFGSQLREYNNRFDQIESDLSIINQDLQDRIEHTKTFLAGEIKVSVESLEKKLKLLASHQQEDMVDVKQQMDRLNRKFSNSLQSLDEAIDTQTNAVREELTQTRHQLQEDIHNLKNLVVEELERRFALLKNGKVSKDDMAEILFELGMRLKGTEFVPKLKEVADGKDQRELLLIDNRK